MTSPSLVVQDQPVVKGKAGRVITLVTERLAEWKRGDITMRALSKEADVSIETVRTVLRDHFGLTKQMLLDDSRSKRQQARDAKIISLQIERLGDSEKNLKREFGSECMDLFVKYNNARTNATKKYGAQLWQMSFKNWLYEWFKTGIHLPDDRRVCLARRDYSRPYLADNIKYVSIFETGGIRRLKESSEGVPKVARRRASNKAPVDRDPFAINGASS